MALAAASARTSAARRQARTPVVVPPPRLPPPGATAPALCRCSSSTAGAQAASRAFSATPAGAETRQRRPRNAGARRGAAAAAPGKPAAPGTALLNSTSCWLDRRPGSSTAASACALDDNRTGTLRTAPATAPSSPAVRNSTGNGGGGNACSAVLLRGCLASRSSKLFRGEAEAAVLLGIVGLGVSSGALLACPSAMGPALPEAASILGASGGGTSASALRAEPRGTGAGGNGSGSGDRRPPARVVPRRPTAPTSSTSQAGPAPSPSTSPPFLLSGGAS
mmetsp:Transcript_19135/g.53302  ORF Transcript_19135/g.53302 Transcript_19135/m.53302 type:complete len:279 (-) Transcript_19135:2-838(-)